jgi:formiminotetrahydrofolate cyclodeaminase
MAIVEETLSSLLERSVGETLKALSQRQPGAAGGSSAGLAGALGAALTSMVARNTQTTWEDASDVSVQADVLRARLCALTVTDSEVYGHARRLLSRAEREYRARKRLPSGRTSASEQRDRELAIALESAALVPLEIAEAAARVAALAAWAAEEAGSDARADAIVASTLAEAAAGAAAQLVLVNLVVRPNDEYAIRASEAARAAAESRTRALAW